DHADPVGERHQRHPLRLQIRQLKQRVHVIVGTPGRVSDLITKKNLKVGNLKYLVIDEADELLNRGFIEEVEGILKKLPADKVTLLFSATMPEKIEAVCAKYMTEPTRLEILSETPTTEKIKQLWYDVADDWKFSLLLKLMKQHEPGSCIIFCNTRTKTEDLVGKLQTGRFNCAALHGGMNQSDRLRIISQFKNGEITYLVATDLAARGLHVDSLDLVINYNVPLETDFYVHRIGRTGRVNETGLALTFVSIHDLNRWNTLQKYLGYEVPLASVDNLEQPTQKKAMPTQPKQQPAVARKEQLNKDIMRLRLNGGKNKKMRPGDIMGAVSSISGILAEDIGIIDIQDSCSYVDILNKKGEIAYEGLLKTTVKGKEISVKKIKIR
ncbi:MAG: DEAD/DEAH box helicase, partial [Vallitaleaceae bacterium]|nr:DEAD/DEAH box helicase [Vallitaleaceae bacterium]